SRNGNIKELVFKPYTHEQLKSILIQRLSSTISNNASSSSCIIDDHITWLDLASRKVAAIHGDCRKVLDVCRHTITGQISDKKMEVTAMDTIKVLNKCYRKDDDNIAKALEYLPFQQQVVLACCLTAMGHDNIEADIHVIKDHINRYMNIHKMPSVTWEVFHDHLQAIAGHGLISILYHHKSKGIQQQPPPPTRRRTTIRGTRGGSASCTSGGQQRVRLIAPFDTLLQGILSNHNKEYFADLLSPQLVLLPPPTNMQQ
ncbi:origin recognition complex subunit, putative, partial [Perkinsus marinus ATCC 50983]